MALIKNQRIPNSFRRPLLCCMALLKSQTKNNKTEKKKKLNVAIFNQDQGHVLHSHFILTNYKSSYYSIKTINYLTKFCNDSVVVKVDLKSNKPVNSKRNSKFHLEKLCI